MLIGGHQGCMARMKEEVDIQIPCSAKQILVNLSFFFVYLATTESCE